VPKITKMDAFSLFQSKTPIFHDEDTPFMPFPSVKEGENDAAVVSKVQASIIQSKKRRDRHTPKIRSVQHIQNSNFRFKSREKRTRGSERCEKDRTAKINFKDLK
jgi:hypothetical protein